MPKFSQPTGTDIGVPGLYDAAVAEVDGYNVEFARIHVDLDFAFMYKGLPNDQCQASHLGYVIKGKIVSRKADGNEEVFEAGDAFVGGPGHTEWLAARTEFVLFTPAEEDAAQAQVVQANLMKYLQDHGIEMPG